MTPEEEVRRADKAKQITENSLFKEAFAEVEEALLRGIRSSPFNAVELREKLCQQYMLLHNVRSVLITHMETGRLAEETLKQQSLRERFLQAIK